MYDFRTRTRRDDHHAHATATPAPAADCPRSGGSVTSGSSSWALAEGWKDFTGQARRSDLSRAALSGDLPRRGRAHLQCAAAAACSSRSSPGSRSRGRRSPRASTNWRGGARRGATRAGGTSSTRSTAAAAVPLALLTLGLAVLFVAWLASPMRSTTRPSARCAAGAC